MMRSVFIAAIGAAAIFSSNPAHANAWEKNYRQLPIAPLGTPWTGEPERISPTGDADADMEAMWRKGFAAIGFTSFKSNNSKTTDAIRLGKKLKARYVMIMTGLVSSRTGAIPWTTPTTQTTFTNGSATVYGNGGTATAQYSGTSTTTGSQTTMIPFTINTYDKIAVYYQEMPRTGTGIYPRDLSNDEMRALGTRKGFVVQFVRDGSPAYQADLFPGDIVTHLNGKPFDYSDLVPALAGDAPLKLSVMRNGQMKQIEMIVPPEWRPVMPPKQ